MAYDSARGKVVLFGGAYSDGYLSDTWEWDGTNWALRSPATSPSARSGAAVAYDSGRGRIVLFGGFNGMNGTNYSYDTWEWDGSSWTQRNPTASPPQRHQAGIAYDSARGVTVLFGGYSGSNYYADTWEWDGTHWLQRLPATSPPLRQGPGMAYDSVRARTVLFGGLSTVRLSDTWEYPGP